MLIKSLAAAVLFLVSTACAEQVVIGPIEQMPNFPQPYEMRDWKQVAHDLDALVFDPNKKGEHLPLIWFDPRKHDFNEPTFALPAYVGHYAKAQNAWDTITCLGAVSGATLVGIDKSNQHGNNWVAMCQNYFSKSDGQNLYLNNVGGQAGGSFWYELLPNILFYRIHYFYPGIGEMDRQFTAVADRWYDASVIMGGKAEPYTLPDFNHTAFDIVSMKPLDNGVWKESDAGGAIAWIEYMAYTKTGDKKYLTAAKWGLDFIQQCKQNPYYEVLAAHGAYMAARMNAQQGTNYDLQRFITWCFDGTNWRHFGISQGKWGDYDCAGLTSSSSEGYGFAMNTFDLAGNLVPIARYDNRFARTIGKWMLNAANSARLMYPYALDKEHQTDLEWSQKYDPTSCIAYEGIQDCKKSFDRATREQTTAGHISAGNIKDTLFTDNKYESLQETKTGSKYQLAHTWEISLTSRTKQVLVMKGHCTLTKGHPGYVFSYKIGQSGAFNKVFTMTSDKDMTLWNTLPDSNGTLYLKVESTSDANDGGTLYVDDLYVRGTADVCPYATGDPRDLGWGATNLGLYGSVFVGIFGAIIETTDVEGILKLDCLATDYYHDKAYPTYLMYNPYKTAKNITINVGTEKKNIYDAVSNTFLVRDTSGKTRIDIPANNAVVIVFTPAGGKLKYDGSKTLINDVIVDYRK